MLTSGKKKFFFSLTLTAAAALTTVVVYRAATWSLIHDEALTFLNHVLGRSYRGIFFLVGDFLSNNHILNTLAVKISTNLLGASELAIRLPSLVAWLIYLAALLWLLKLLLKGWWLLLGFLLVVCHPVVLDFFSLARGYALALAGSFLSLAFLAAYYFDELIKPSAKKYLIIFSSLSAALGVWANFSFLNLAVAINLLWLVAWSWEFFSLPPVSGQQLSGRLLNWTEWLWPRLLCLVPGLLLAGAALPLIFKLQRLGELYAGGEQWLSTASSLAKISAFNVNWLTTIFYVAVALLAVGLPIYLFLRRKFFNKDQPFSAAEWVAGFLWLLTILLYLMLIAQHLFWGVKFPVERTALYFLPLFSSLAFLSAYALGEGLLAAKKILGQIWQWLFSLAVLALLIFFVSKFNNKNNTFWFYDLHTKEIVDILRETLERRGTAGGRLFLGVNWMLEPAVNYYLWQKRVNYDFTTRHHPDGIYDYYYLLPEDKWLIGKYNLVIIKKFDAPEVYLATPLKFK